MLAVVMAGGKGTRLRPLTCNKPKPMVPVAGKPLLDYVLRLLAKGGWDEVALTLCYLPEQVEAYFGDGRRFGVKLHYLVEDQPLGTAGSVKSAASFFDGTVLIGSGDALSDFDFRAALAFHRERRALVTVILTRVESPLEYGVVMTEPAGRIVRFLEKPGWGEVFSDTVNTGFYLVEPEVFDLVPAGRPFDFSRDLFPVLLERGAGLYGYVADGYWSDIGTIEQYRRSHLDFLGGRMRLDPPGREIGPGVWAGQGVEIHPDARIEGPAYLGDYCRIERGAHVGPFTCLGEYGFMGEGSSVKHSVLWRQVYLGPGTEVRGAILGDHTVLRNNVSVYEGAVLGSECLVGAYAVISPQVKLWPAKSVESGSTVRDNMIWSERSLKGLFGAAGVTGVANLEITPEFAVRLGAAFATTIGPGRELTVAGDGFPAARLLKRAVTTGILGAGVGVKDLGTASVPMARYAVGALGLAGGIHLGLSSRDRRQVVIQFLDARGLPVTRQTERAVEQVFLAEDFARVEAARVGELSYAPNLAEMYLDGLKDLVNAQAIAEARLGVVLGPMSGPTVFLLPGLLARLGCPHVRLDVPGQDPGQPQGADSFLASREAIAAKLAEKRGCLAVSTDNAGEELFVLAPGGEVVDQAKLATLISLAELRRHGGTRLPLPVTATEAIADLARDLRGQIVRVKGQRRSLLEEFAAASPATGGLLLPALDALAALARLLELLAVEGRDLGALLGKVPAYARVERFVTCAWETKGRLMRRLIEENQGRSLDLTDGLRVQAEEGWALILPDGEEPCIRVLSEAGTAEEADALNRLYLERVAALGREQEVVASRSLCD